MKVWILYDKRPPHLPVKMFRSAVELAEYAGVADATVRSVASRAKHGDSKSYMYACVDLEDEK